MTGRVVILGARGQVGSALAQSAPLGVELTTHDSSTVDLRSDADVTQAIGDASPTVVVNCAAYTRVDDAESDAHDAMQVNGIAPGVMAAACRRIGARFVQLSTDYVFDGCGTVPYATDAVAAPLNVYGITKLEGERRALHECPRACVIRTSWVHAGRGANFVATTVGLLTAGRPMQVVDDQVGTPTRARHLADALWRLVERPQLTGILHFTDAGVASWYDVARVVRATLHAADRLPEGTTVAPVGSDAFPRPAVRPRMSLLDKRHSWQQLGYTPVDWRDGVTASTLELIHA